MPGLTLDITGAAMSRDFGSYAFDDTRWLLSHPAKISDAERLRLSTGEDIKDVDMRVNFKSVTADYREHYLKQITEEKRPSELLGMLTYFPSRASDLDFVPATVFFEIFLSEDEFADLIKFSQHGRHPTRITVRISDDLGMKYGWEPDGSGKDWDTVSSQRIPIDGASLVMKFAEAASAPEPPASSPLLPLLRQSLVWQQCIFVLLLAIGVGLLLKR